MFSGKSLGLFSWVGLHLWSYAGPTGSGQDLGQLKDRGNYLCQGLGALSAYLPDFTIIQIVFYSFVPQDTCCMRGYLLPLMGRPVFTGTDLWARPAVAQSLRCWKMTVEMGSAILPYILFKQFIWRVQFEGF